MANQRLNQRLSASMIIRESLEILARNVQLARKINREYGEEFLPPLSCLQELRFRMLEAARRRACGTLTHLRLAQPVPRSSPSIRPQEFRKSAQGHP